MSDTERLAPALTLPAITANDGYADVSAKSWVAAGFAQAVVDGQEPFTEATEWKHKVDYAALLPPDTVVLRSYVDRDDLANSCVFARTPTGHLHINDNTLTVSATTPQAAQHLLQTIVERLPATDGDPGKAEVKMWHEDRHGGGCSHSKVIDVPRWTDVKDNYPGTIGHHLDRLMTRGRPPATSGKLVVWYGPPGTGKTTAIRTLMREWSSWCTHHYVPDPERFFSSVRYMANVLSNSDSDSEPTHRLVVVEDCDEFITADARHRSGNALGRLLNLSDGIMGQGSKVIILLTTNEDITALHPALTRPGRCLAKVEFRPFTAEQARAWLPDPTLPLPSTTPTLAELFEKLSSTPRIATRDDTSAPGLYL